MKKLRWLCAIVLFTAGCNHLGGAARTTTPSPSAIGPAAREYLASDEEEEAGYGFYSYLLLGKAPTPANIERYRAAFDAFLRIVPKQQQRLAPAQLNLTYALVTSTPPDSVRAIMVGALPDDPRRKAAIDWLIENHDYARSADVLRHIGRLGAPGPFIVQAPQPIAGVSDVKEVIVQDLSVVESSLVGDVVDHVLAASDQKQSWASDELQSYLLQIRNFCERLGINAQRVTALVAWIPFDKLLGS